LSRDAVIGPPIDFAVAANGRFDGPQRSMAEDRSMAGMGRELLLMNVKFATNILAAAPCVKATINVATGFIDRRTSMCNTTASRSEVLRNFLLQTQWVKKPAGNPTIPANFLLTH